MGGSMKLLLCHAKSNLEVDDLGVASHIPGNLHIASFEGDPYGPMALALPFPR